LIKKKKDDSQVSLTALWLRSLVTVTLELASDSMANSTERSFSIISGYNFDKTYDGIAIPLRWQRWETAHIYRISSLMENPSEPARLLSYGCNVHDPDVFSNGEDPWPDPSHLNCTETCSDPALMYASPENLWNCMTLATVAMMVVQVHCDLA
jgi:hypothetical protein